jgi:hypothetical protein
VKIVALGAIARGALGRSGGLAQPLAAFAASPWYEAGGEILWIGAKLPALHPRAVLTATSPKRGQPLGFNAIPRSCWSPRSAPRPPARVREVLRRVRRALVASHVPSGFGVLVAGAGPAFPLDLAMAQVEALARAARADDVAAAQAPASALIGVGAGLTPSGDDLLGGLLFAKRWLRPRDERWALLGKRLAAEMRERSHAVSATLFADLASGTSFAPLHDLRDALAARHHERALAAGSTLASIGHSSGWDMLAGFFLGAGALPVRRR